jgi:predicted DNA-binding transcriptional regulator AlpA
MNTENYLSSSEVRRRYGGRSGSCLRRWQRDPSVAFPEPIMIGHRRYWPLSELQRWEALCSLRGTQKIERVS